MRLIFLSLQLLLLTACQEDKKGNPVTSPVATVKVNGEALFNANCAQCHRPATDFAAPALAGVEKRWKSKELLYEFIRHSEDVIARDAYAMTLYKKWNQAYMQPFSHLSNEEIDAILRYCNLYATQTVQ